jgi:hypothetical protein
MVTNVRERASVIYILFHAGVVNIATCPELFLICLYALVGGLHLVHPNEDLIGETIRELENLALGDHSRALHWMAIHTLCLMPLERWSIRAVGSRVSLKSHLRLISADKGG